MEKDIEDIDSIDSHKMYAEGCNSSTAIINKAHSFASNFSASKDFLCIQAFYWTFKYSITGSKQTMSVFQKRIEDCYNYLVSQQLGYEKKVIISYTLLEDEGKTLKIGKIQDKNPQRSGSSLHQCAIKKIIPTTIMLICVIKAVSCTIFYKICLHSNLFFMIFFI